MIPLKPSSFLSRARDDCRRGSSHKIRIRIKRRHPDVRRHHRIDSSIDCFAKWRQVDRAQHLHILVYPRQRQMRVRPGIAVSRKVLGRRQHSVRSRPANVGSHQCPHLLGIGAERSCADDRIRWIGIHIGDRKEIPVHADRPALLRRNSAELFGVRRLARCAKSHGMRKYGGPEKTRRKHALLKISGNQQAAASIPSAAGSA